MTEIEPEEEEVSSASKKWTLLIYQAGDNNLNEECIYALKEMKRIGTLQTVSAPDAGSSLMNVVIEFDPAGRANPTRRFRITRSGEDGTIHSDIIKTMGEIDTGEANNLLNFLCENVNRYRTDNYMVILAGHGAGVREGFFLKDEERPLASIPNSFPIHMLREVFRSPRLKSALRGRKIDILGFDACMMSMVEVCYELRATGTLEFVLASEGFTLNSGWPMDRVMARIKRCPEIEPKKLATSVVEDYVEYYRDYVLGGVSIDQSVINLNKVEHLKTKIDELAKRMVRAFEEEARKKPFTPDEKKKILEHDDGYDEDEDEYAKRDDEVISPPTTPSRPAYYYRENGRPFQDAVLLAHWAAQSYNGEQCVDLFDFCDLLQKRRPSNEHTDVNSIWHACQEVKEVLANSEDPFIVRSCYSGASVQYSYGASLYFPWGQFDCAPSYSELAFADHSYWYKFLKVYLSATKRRPRRRVGFKRLDENVRYTPPTNRGPSGTIFSMRNPPTTFWEMPCYEEEGE